MTRHDTERRAPARVSQGVRSVVKRERERARAAIGPRGIVGHHEPNVPRIHRGGRGCVRRDRERSARSPEQRERGGGNRARAIGASKHTIDRAEAVEAVADVEGDGPHREPAPRDGEVARARNVGRRTSRREHGQRFGRGQREIERRDLIARGMHRERRTRKGAPAIGEASATVAPTGIRGENDRTRTVDRELARAVVLDGLVIPLAVRADDTGTERRRGLTDRPVD